MLRYSSGSASKLLILSCAADKIQAAHILKQSDVLLGRAMGRVLAHELCHIVADTAEHGELRSADVEAIQSGLRQGR
jgi:hypothetical protein